MSSSFRTKLCRGQSEKAITVKIFINGLSDHDTQLLILNKGQKKEKECHTYIKRKINNYTIDFQLKLSHETWEPVFDGNDVNQIFNSFLNIFLRIYYSSFPLIQAKSKMNQNSWITPGIITSCKCKRQLYKEDKTKASNYKPISLLTTFSKVLEKALFNRLIEHIEKNNILSKQQFGFRKRYATEDAIFKLTHKILSALNEKAKVCGIFCDLEKAFDAVNHSILI
jgi:hypothetical protein